MFPTTIEALIASGKSADEARARLEAEVAEYNRAVEAEELEAEKASVRYWEECFAAVERKAAERKARDAELEKRFGKVPETPDEFKQLAQIIGIPNNQICMFEHEEIKDMAMSWFNDRASKVKLNRAVESIFAPIREADKTIKDAIGEICEEAQDEIRESQSAKSRCMEEIATNARRGVAAAVDGMNAGRRASELPALYWPTKSADPSPPASPTNGKAKKTVLVVVEEVEKIVKARKGKWPGYAALVEKGYAKGTLQNAVKQSVYLKARLAESEAARTSGKKPKVVSLTETVANIEAGKRETELRRLGKMLGVTRIATNSGCTRRTQGSHAGVFQGGVTAT
ncbi:MAG: hypothetical protein FWD61_14805 [Phycisphaerales bacterium]|nr:hypothetical protein [Phycisphaerales bacterium]